MRIHAFSRREVLKLGAGAAAAILIRPLSAHAQSGGHLYLAPYVGTGVIGLDDKGQFAHDPWRPRGSEQPGWAAIDLRPGGVGLSGFALMLVPVRDNTIGDYLGGDVTETSLTTKSTMESKLGVTLQETVTAQMLAELLMVHGKDDGTRWKNLRVHRDGMYRLWLGGKTPLWEGKSISGGATITESFDTADSDTLGPNLTWTELTGDWDIVSNEAALQTTATRAYVRANTPLATDDHYSQIKMTNDFGGGTYWEIAPMCRKDNSGTITCYLLIAQNINVGNEGRALYRINSGSLTSLASDTGLITVNDIFRIEADADQLTGKVNGSTVLGPTTDGSPITGNLYCGFEGYHGNTAGVVRCDLFEAGDLAAGAVGIESEDDAFEDDSVIPWIQRHRSI